MTTRRLTWPHLALALLALALAPRARGADGGVGVMAVGAPPGPGTELVVLTGQLRAALRARDPRVLEGAALRLRMVGPPPPASLADLDRAYAGALTAYGNGDYDQAVRTLRVVTADLEQLPESPAVLAAWTRAVLRLARVEQVLGRAVEAQADLERLLGAAPQVSPDPRQFPPSFLALVEEARQRLATSPRWPVTVEAGPGVNVFVDGRDLGPPPATLELPAGRHRVAAIRGGGRVATAVVEIAGPRAVHLDTSLADVLRPDAGPGLALAPEDLGPGAVKAGARLGLERVVTVSTRQVDEATYLVAAVYEVRQGILEREGRLRLAGGAAPPRGPEALAAFLLTGQGSGLVSTPAGPSLPAPPPPRPHAHLGSHLQMRGLLGQVSSSAPGLAFGGLGGSLDFTLGWSVAPDVVLGANLWLAGPFGSNKPMVVAISPEVVWYLMPANVYVAPAIGLGRTVLQVNGTSVIDTGLGLHAQLTVGKEWLVGGGFGVGLAGQVSYTTSPGNNGSATWSTWSATTGLSIAIN